MSVGSGKLLCISLWISYRAPAQQRASVFTVCSDQSGMAGKGDMALFLRRSFTLDKCDERLLDILGTDLGSRHRVATKTDNK